MIAGAFTTIGGQARNYMARLNSDGSLDPTFDPAADGPIYALAQQSDGILVVAGNFTVLGGQARNRIARLDANGGLDLAYAPSADDSVVSMALQLDGRLIVAGEFGTLNGQPRNGIARLNADGSLDAAFNANANNSSVIALALQSDGKLLVGGIFSSIGGQARNNLARLSMPQSALQSLSVTGYTAGGSVITWKRSGAGPELLLPPQLLFSLGGSTFAPVATMQRIDGGWRATGFAPPLASNFSLRTRAQPNYGHFNGSTGLIERTRRFYLDNNDGIFTNDFD